MHTCEFFLTTAKGPKLVGTVTLDDKSLGHTAVHGHEKLMNTIATESVSLRGEHFAPGDDPEKWFDALPFQYSGSYLRATITSKAKKTKATKNLAKLGPHTIKTHRLAPQSILAKNKLERTLRDHFKEMKRTTTKEIAKGLDLPNAHIKLSKADKEQDAVLKQILNNIADEWEKIAQEAQEPFEGAVLAGVGAGALQLDISSEDMLSTINEIAQDWASARAAEMVGMIRTARGKLVANPDAKWSISDTTRDDLKIVIRDLFGEENPTLATIEKRIMDSGIFSDMRASMIARTEISRAQTEGNLATWRESGLVKSVSVQLSADHDSATATCDCDDIAEGSPYAIDSVPDVPVHPNCECVIVLSDEMPEEG